MRAAAWLALAALGVGGAGAGCDWRDFDNIQAGAPVLRAGPPTGYSAPNDFGHVILPLTPPADGSAAARFLGSAIGQTGLALVDITATGQGSNTNITGLALDNLLGDPITSMAEVPGAGEALLGIPIANGGTLLTVNLTSLMVTPFAVSGEPLFGMGVAAGGLSGAGAKDLVTVSSTAIHVYLNGASTSIAAASSAACPIAISTTLPSLELVNRAVVIGAFMGGTALQVAVGTPVTSGGGSVSFFSVNATAGTVGCVQVLSAPAAADSRFGQALAIGDFDNDGIPDLLVGAPPTRAYLYRGPIAAGAAPAATITDSSGGGDFGAAVAALNLDGKPGDEALIGDPNATVDGQAQAGNVSIYTGPALATKLTTVLADHDPSGGETYGSAVAALPFCATMPCPTAPPRLALVGAAAQIFTYFDPGLGAADPRTK
jgi:FG-GAP repeat